MNINKPCKVFSFLLIIVLSISARSTDQPTPKADLDLGYTANPDQILGIGIEQTAKKEQPVERRKGGPTGSGIQYIREEVPAVEIPPIKGKYYEALVPDTFDLAERARLAVHGMTECTDPDADYEIYGWGGFPTMRHDYHDYNGGQAKWMQNLPLLRTVSGSTYNMHVDHGMMGTMFHMLGEDGLYWIPMIGSPWTSHWPWVQEGAKQVYDIWPTGRALMALTEYHMRAPENQAYRKCIETMIDGLIKISIDKGDYCYIRRHFYDGQPQEEERLWVVEDGKLALGPVALPTGITVVTTHSTLLSGICRYYESTKYPPAKQLADKLANYLLGPAKIMREDGTWEELTHFHGMLFALMSLLDYGLVMDRPDIIQQVAKGYDYARNVGHIPSGWMPEYSPITHAGSEPCGIGDMVVLASRLSHLGLGDYWEDVERISRNLLAEAQITGSAGVGENSREVLRNLPPDTPNVTSDRVEERMIGTFRGMVSINGQASGGFSHCCTGNAGRSLYFAWRHAVDAKDGVLKVNLLLNRASKWLDIDSYLPFEGKVEIRNKTAKQISVRIPRWVDEKAVTSQINGSAAKPFWAGRYLVFPNLKPKDAITLSFPVTETTETYTLKWKQEDFWKECTNPGPNWKPLENPTKYTLRLRGNTVVDISPRDPGPGFPLYLRDELKKDKAPMKKVVRHIPQVMIKL